jgi:uncharacterized protein YodC (DUF2158 family)
MPDNKHWLPSICAAVIHHERFNQQLVCGLQQFQTKSGAVCEKGHGGADGIDVSELKGMDKRVAKANAEIAFGDHVRLTTGGPTMVVVGDGKGRFEGALECVWFIHLGDDNWTGPHRDVFNKITLELVA